jgi:hypothetical protein
MHYFCTYFDHRYLSRGLALYKSLNNYCKNFKLFILCLSQNCYDILRSKDLKNVFLLRLEEIEDCDEELLEAKRNRTLIEYYFTLTPSYILYILKNFEEIDLITYLDADIYFFSNPQPIFEEMGESSIAIISHRFPKRLKHFEKYGVYNVSWMSFRRDINGLSCLKWFRERCNEWCYDRIELDKFADQKYLEKFEELFNKVHIIQHKGANVAPWNIENYNITISGSQIYIENQVLIFYHFHGLKKILPFLYDTGLSNYGSSLFKVVRNNIYLPYIKDLIEIENENKNLYKKPLKRTPKLYIKLPFSFVDFLKLVRSIFYNSLIFINNKNN